MRLPVRVCAADCAGTGERATHAFYACSALLLAPGRYWPVALVVACGGVQECPGKIVVKFLLCSTELRRVENTAQVFLPQPTVGQEVGFFYDRAGFLELYRVEPGREYRHINVDDAMVPPVGVPAVNDMCAAVAVGELVRGMIQHPRPHAQFA